MKNIVVLPVVIKINESKSIFQRDISDPSKLPKEFFNISFPSSMAQATKIHPGTHYQDQLIPD